MQLFAGARRVLFFHAHPDDESLWTGGLIARLTAAGVRVKVVTATRGERGEVVPGPLKALEGTPELAEHREGELARALAELGAGRPLFLGGYGAAAHYNGPGFRYVDSGMIWGDDGRATIGPDTPAGHFAGNANAFADARAVVRRFRPDAVVSYDAGGGYGHPDHEWTHVVARAAARRHGAPFIEVVPAGAPAGAGPSTTAIAHDIDLGAKRRALAAHASQLTLTDDGYELSGGQRHVLEPVEYYRVGG
jgi:N-acetyl-1-D-myo-inositol-2-amino-2-deoxy-alpha-D-glucopyranoside deacetylase